MITAKVTNQNSVTYENVKQGTVFEFKDTLFLECTEGNIELDGFVYRSHPDFFEDFDVSGDVLVLAHGTLNVSKEAKQ